MVTFGKERTVFCFLDTQHALAGNIGDAQDEVGFAQCPRGTPVGRCTPVVFALDQVAPPKVGCRFAYCTRKPCEALDHLDHGEGSEHEPPDL